MDAVGNSSTSEAMQSRRKRRRRWQRRRPQRPPNRFTFDTSKCGRAATKATIYSAICWPSTWRWAATTTSKRSGYISWPSCCRRIPSAATSSSRPVSTYGRSTSTRPSSRHSAAFVTTSSNGPFPHVTTLNTDKVIFFFFKFKFYVSKSLGTMELFANRIPRAIVYNSEKISLRQLIRRIRRHTYWISWKYWNIVKYSEIGLMMFGSLTGCR